MSEKKINQAQSVYLDLLRASAALMVLFGHSSSFFMDGGWLWKLHIAPAGVIIFFLLSGFLITYSALRKYNNTGYSFKEFLIDRFARIYTAFIPALFFVLFIDYFTLRLPIYIPTDRTSDLTWISSMSEGYNIQTWLGSLLMLQDHPLFQIARLAGVPDNKWFIGEFGSAAPFWTVSIEWWIYIAFGIAVLFLIRDRHRIRLWHIPIFSFIAITPAYFFVGGTYNCLTLLWLFGMGTCYIYLKLSQWLKNYRWPVGSIGFGRACLLVCSIGLIGMAGRLLDIKLDTGSVDYNELQFSFFVALALFGMLFALERIQSVPSFISRPINFIANYSFSLYLTHATILVHLYIRFPSHDRDPQFFWLAIIVSNIVAIIFWWLFERHYHLVAKWLKARFIGRV